MGDGGDVCRVSVVPMLEGTRKHEIWCSTACRAILSLLRHVAAVIDGSTLISQSPQCTCPIPPMHHLYIMTEIRTFLFWMVHCAIWAGGLRCETWEIGQLSFHTETHFTKNLTGNLCYHLRCQAKVMFPSLLILGLSVCLSESYEIFRVALTWY